MSEISSEAKQTSATLKRERSSTIDVMRGVAMILVLLVHMGSQDYIGYSMMMLLYYSVPIFFVISGYLLVTSAQTETFWLYLWKRVKGLLLPYLFFFVFCILWNNTVYAYLKGVPLFGFEFNWMNILKAFAFSGEFLYQLAIVPPPLWFLHALFLTSIVYYFIAKIKNKYVLCALALVLLIATLPLQAALQGSPYWIVSLFPAALFFMIIGSLCRIYQLWYQGFNERLEAEGAIKRKTPTIINSFLGLVLIVASLFVMPYGRGDIWAITSDWYFLGALLFVGGVFLFAKETKNKVLIFTGRRSLYYLGVHALLLEIPFFVRLPQLLTDRSFDKIATFIGWFIITFLCVSLLVLIIVYCKDKLALLFKKSPKEPIATAD